jgi:PadR family transcriptional regulator PadR
LTAFRGEPGQRCAVELHGALISSFLYILTTCAQFGMPKTQYLTDFELFVMLAAAALASGEAYGISIQRHIEQRTKRVISIGAVYATVERLVEKGYLKTSLSGPIPTRGGRARKLVTLTAAGSAAVRESTRALARMLDGLRWAAPETQ